MSTRPTPAALLRVEAPPIQRLSLSISEAAVALSISESTIAALIRANLIPHVRISAGERGGRGRIVLPIRALERWLDDQAQRATADQPATATTEGSNAA